MKFQTENKLVVISNNTYDIEKFLNTFHFTIAELDLKDYDTDNMEHLEFIDIENEEFSGTFPFNNKTSNNKNNNSNENVENDEDNLLFKQVVTFTTQYNTPINECIELCNKYPNIEIILSYYNVDMEYFGRLEYQYQGYHIEEEHDMVEDDLKLYLNINTPCSTENEAERAKYQLSAGDFKEFLTRCDMVYIKQLTSKPTWHNIIDYNDQRRNSI